MGSFDAWVNNGGGGAASPAGTYSPTTYGAVGDGSTDNLAALNSLMAALPTSGGTIVFPAGSFRLSAPWHVYKPVIIVGQGGGLTGTPATQLKLDAGAGVITDTAASSPFGGPGANGTVIRDINFFGSAPCAVWQANHAYTVGTVVINTKWYGGFTQFINIVTVAGTSGGSEPAWPVRGDSDTYQHEGATTTDGGVTWASRSCPGLWMKTITAVEHCYFQQCYGDGVYAYGYSGVAPSTGCSGFHVQDCSGQLNLGRGWFAAGTDAQGSIINGFLAQNNWSGGIADFSDVGNAYTGCLSETNGVFFWGAGVPITNFNPIGGGTVTVPTPAVMDAMQTATGKVYFYSGAGSGSTGITEPVWPTTIGLTVSDSGITWTCAGEYRYGQAFQTTATLNASTFTGCYQEPDQRLNEVAANVTWIGDIGGFFRASIENKFLRIQPNASSPWVYIDNSGATPKVHSIWGDTAGNPSAFKIAMDDGAGNEINPYQMLADADGKHWSWEDQSGHIAMKLSNAGATEGAGKVVFPTGLMLSNSTGYATPFNLQSLAIDQFGSPPPNNGTLGDIVLQRYVRQGFPGGWLNTSSDQLTPSATWQEFNFDTTRYLSALSDGIGSPFAIVDVFGTTRRGTVYTNYGTNTKVAATLAAATFRTGRKYHFFNEQPTGSWRINAGASQQIQIGNLICAVAGYVETTSPGAWLTLESFGEGPVYVATAIIGQWTVDGNPIIPAVPNTESLLSTTLIDSSVGTKQNLYTVPTGYSLVVTKAIIRSISGSVTTAAAGLGFDASATNVATNLDIPTATGTYRMNVSDSAVAATVGAAAAVLGVKFTATDTRTMTIDVFGYLF